MNANTYLRAQGWKGSGHSLDARGQGIKRPLLVTHKQDQQGLGHKSAAHRTDDQWWLRAFDQSLQAVGAREESVLNQIRTKGVRHGGLYGFFVKGEDIAGTIEEPCVAITTNPPVLQLSTNSPATSTIRTDAAAEETARSRKKAKRKRDDKHRSSDAGKAKDRREKHSVYKTAVASRASEHEDAVAAKLAKMKPRAKAKYEARAAEKNQSMAHYVLRRIQKRAEKQAIASNRKTDQ